MITLNEYRQIKFLVEEIGITRDEANYMVENVMGDFINRMVRKYALSAAVVAAIVSGQGCNRQQCPTPQIQQQIKQELSQETKQSPAKEIIQLSPKSYEVIGTSQVLTVLGRGKGLEMAHRKAKQDATMKLFKYLKINNANISVEPIESVSNNENVVSIKYKITLLD